MGGRGRWFSVESEASLVYKVSSRTFRATQRNPVLKTKKKGTKERKKWREGGERKEIYGWRSPQHEELY